MPFKVEREAINDKFLDRRVKMLPCQKEQVISLYNRGASIRGIARMYNVDKRLIQFIIFPERHKKNLQDRKDRGGSSIYYDKENHTKQMREHRRYKHEVLHGITIKYVKCPIKFIQMANKDGYVLEYRLIMANQLGRPLLNTECVHHIDHNPTNNDITNLMLFATNKDHKVYEAGGIVQPLWQP